jgi:hypothetical protein
MEGSGAQSVAPRDRSHPAPPFPRTDSRSSGSSARTRMTTPSTNSSASPATHSHRYHHSSCARTSAIERPRSQLSREATDEPSLPPVSSFLQERLQRGRKIESERSASRMSNDMTTASLDMRAVQSSPPQGGQSEGRRPISSGGAETTKKKGLGLKEMEQVR